MAEALKQPEYVHVLLNHLPITGLLVATLTLIATICLQGRASVQLSLALVALLSFSAWPVAHYGEAGFDRVLAMSDEAGGQYLKHHRELAERWIFLSYTTGAAACAAMVIGWKWPRHLKISAGIVVLLAAASLVAGAVIADYGGPIRHREFRIGPAPGKHTEVMLSYQSHRLRGQTFCLDVGIFQTKPGVFRDPFACQQYHLDPNLVDSC